jgi:hypothetical protein
MPALGAIAAARKPVGREGRSGDLIKPLIVYALLSLIAATRRPSGGGDSDSTDRLSNGGRTASGAFGATRSTDEPRSVQHDRASEDDRGRRASAPWQIPWSGWKDIFWRTYGQIGEDRLLAVAAGVVFYGLLALFPAVTAFVSLYGSRKRRPSMNTYLLLAA